MIRQFSAGGVVFKKTGNTAHFLLRRAAPNPGYMAANQWGLPKGWLDDADNGQNPGPKTLGKVRATSQEVQDAALREVHEEAGVEVKVIKRLGGIKFFFFDKNKQRVFKTVIFFLMEYVSDLPQGFGSETAETRWVDLPEAKTLLKSRKNEYDLLVIANELLK